MSEAAALWRAPCDLCRTSALATLLLLGACASSPPPRALVIIPSASEAMEQSGPSTMAPMPAAPEASPRASEPAAQAVPRGIALAPLRLPEHWQRRQVLHLRDDAELVAWPNAVWAERVETGMTRRLAQALRQRAPQLGWWTADDALSHRRLLIDVQQLDVHAGRGEVVAALSWRLVDRQGRVLDGGHLADRLQAPMGDARQQAQALARWLDAQAEALVARLPPGRLP